MKFQITVTPAEFQECIRHLYCMGPKEFAKVFGDDDGDGTENYYWRKFKKELKGDAGKFLCYLDSGNMRLLLEHFSSHLRKHERLFR